MTRCDATCGATSECVRACVPVLLLLAPSVRISWSEREGRPRFLQTVGTRTGQILDIHHYSLSWVRRSVLYFQLEPTLWTYHLSVHPAIRPSTHHPPSIDGPGLAADSITSTMALSPVYAAILQDLNKAVSQSQPEDVLQFCANWVSPSSVFVRVAWPAWSGHVVHFMRARRIDGMATCDRDLGMLTDRAHSYSHLPSIASSTPNSRNSASQAGSPSPRPTLIFAEDMV